MINDFFKLAFKNLKHRGIRSWLTLLGIFIGVTAVVSLISLGAGLKIAVSSQFGIASTEILTIQSGGSGAQTPGAGIANPLTTEDLDEIKKLPSVKRAVGRNMAIGQIEFKDKSIFSPIMNIPGGKDRDFIYEQIEAKTFSGNLLDENDFGKVLLGYNFYANKVGLDRSVKSGNYILINGEKYEVKGILEKKGSFVYDNSIFLNDFDMKKINDPGNKLNSIAVQPVNKNEIDKTKEDIEKVLRKNRNVKLGEEDFVVSTPEANMKQINEILNGIQIFIIIIASISIFIGAIGIVNTMTTSVLERRRDIGIMKSIGATNTQVFLQFFIEAGLLGLIGGLIGTLTGSAIGALGTLIINKAVGSEIPISINFTLIFSVLVGSFIIGGVAGITPAMKAAKENPVKALRD